MQLLFMLTSATETAIGTGNGSLGCEMMDAEEECVMVTIIRSREI